MGVYRWNKCKRNRTTWFQHGRQVDGKHGDHAIMEQWTRVASTRFLGIQHCKRQYSTMEKEMERLIKKIYFMIHPDRFVRFGEDVQKKNSNALLEIKEFIERHQGGFQTVSDSVFYDPKPLLLVFYLLEDGDLKCHQVQLRGCSVNSGTERKKKTLMENLSKLFRVMKIKVNENWMKTQYMESEEYTYPGALNLLRWLYSSQDISMGTSRDQYQHLMSKRIDVSMLRDRIGFWLGCDGFIFLGHSVEIQLSLIHQFRRVLEKEFVGLDTSEWNRKLRYSPKQSKGHSSSRHDRLKDRLRGHKFYVDQGRCRIAVNGDIYCGSKDSPEKWLRWIEHEFDPHTSRKRLERRQKMVRLQNATAKHLHCNFIASENEEMLMSYEYESYLTEILRYAWESQPIDYKCIYIYIVSSSTESIEVHRKSGSLLVPLGHEVYDIFNKLQQYGQSLESIARTRIHERDQLIQQTNLVRRALGLASLFYANNLGHHQVLECCSRLMKHKEVLRPLLSNLEVVISDGFKISNPSVEIPYNFTMEKRIAKEKSPGNGFDWM